jgi:hypothetical protein
VQVVTAVGAYAHHYEAKTHLRHNLPRRNLRRGTYVYALNIPRHVTWLTPSGLSFACKLVLFEWQLKTALPGLATEPQHMLSYDN